MTGCIRGVKDKRMKELMKFLEKGGCELGLTGSNHVAVRRGGRLVCTMSYTTSDHRAYIKARAELRRVLPDIMTDWQK